jgi:hypothetical protein
MMKTILTAILLCASVGCNPVQSRTGHIPTGTIDDCMKSEASFYSIRGGSDYSRASVLFPYHLTDVAGAIDLSAGKDTVAENVLSVGLTNGMIIGSSGPYQAFGKTVPAQWFVVDVTTRQVRTMQTEQEFRDALRTKGIDPSGVLPSREVVDSFMKRGTDRFQKGR